MLLKAQCKRVFSLPSFGRKNAMRTVFKIDQSRALSKEWFCARLPTEYETDLRVPKARGRKFGYYNRKM